MSNILNTPDTTASYSQQDIDQNKIMGILSYFGILVLIPIFAAKESPFARFHANQGLVLLVTGILVGMATSLVGMLFGLIHIDVLTVLWNIVSWLIRVAMFALMILGFTFFYSSISFNPVEISKNMQQNGGMIPGIRQGKPTSDFIQRISRRITLFGALFLAFLAVLPTVIYAIFRINLPFAASSLLIAVSVAMETMRQLESQMTMRHYKGFLN